MTHRPAVVAFDVIETLMSLEPLRERLTEIGQPPHLLEAWYTRTLRDGMALSATGDYAGFTDVAEAALSALTHFTISSLITSAMIGSRPVVGSSRNRTPGRCMRLRMISSFRFIPPE